MLAMPTNESLDAQAGKGILKKSPTVYQEFLAEREEILKHKWLESEKAGHDVGFEYALTDWIINHRSKWLKTRRDRRRPDQESP